MPRCWAWSLVQHCKTRLVVDGLRLIGHDSGAENENKAPSGIRRWLGLLPRNFVAHQQLSGCQHLLDWYLSTLLTSLSALKARKDRLTLPNIEAPADRKCVGIPTSQGLPPLISLVERALRRALR